MFGLWQIFCIRFSTQLNSEAIPDMACVIVVEIL